jgi:hypothetical protein
MSTRLILTDDHDAIVIEKSGAPAPSEELCAWLRSECRGAYRHHADSAFNVVFEFDEGEDARRFRERWVRDSAD